MLTNSVDVLSRHIQFAMAEKRKLMAEMEKCFKKVDEGVDLFSETMNKMSEANSENQREKFQDDLKKEIKKLQRLRDQIKGWQSSSDVKDKEKLNQYRKHIENHMETFKDIERENKTKPHSKQGLSAEEKLDPREKERTETIEWLQSCIRRFNDESDAAESKIESLGSTDQGKKRGKKDEPKKAEKEQRAKKIEELKHFLERMKFHISKIEVVMRLVNNETLDSKYVNEHLKDPVEMYIDALDPCNEDDPEMLDPEAVYDDLDLASYTQQLGGVTAIGTLDDADNSNPSTSPSSSPGPSKEISTDTIASEMLSSSVGPLNVKQRHSSGDAHIQKSVFGFRSTPSTPLKLTNQMSSESVISSPPTVASPPPTPNMPYNAVAGSGLFSTRGVSVSKTTSSSAASSKQTTPGPVEVTSVTPVSWGETATVNVTTATATTIVSSYRTSSPVSALSVIPSVPIQSSQSIPVPCSVQQNQNHFSYANGPAANKEVMTLKSMAEQATTAPLSSDPLDAFKLLSTSERQCVRVPQQAYIPPLLGASPLGKAPVAAEHSQQLMMMDMALQRMPQQMDSEKPRAYLPNMSCPTPTYYPQHSPSNADTLEYYLRLSPETLFFVFYYMEGTRAQLLAAKALKKLSWRFHTKYLMWFQRHEEPKQITDDYEQGTYVYFDYERWMHRKKEGFTFEYKYLEDKELD